MNFFEFIGVIFGGLNVLNDVNFPNLHPLLFLCWGVIIEYGFTSVLFIKKYIL